MKKNTYINEVRELQKIAGLLKEDEFDLSDNPLKSKKRYKKVLVDLLADECKEFLEYHFDDWKYAFIDAEPNDEIQAVYDKLSDSLAVDEDFEDMMEEDIFPEVRRKVFGR
jgi:hypothetical protein